MGAFVVFTGFGYIPDPSQQAAFLLVLAALHGVVAAAFLVRRGTLDPFGLLAAAFGLALASMAVPLLLGASLTAVVWSAEAAALAVLAGRRAHAPSLMAELVLLVVGGSKHFFRDTSEPIRITRPPHLEAAHRDSIDEGKLGGKLV